MADFKDEQEYHTSRLRSYLNIPEQSELETLSDIKLADKQSELASGNPAQIIIQNEWKRREKIELHNLNRRLIEIQNKTNKKLLANQYELNKKILQSQALAEARNRKLIITSLISIIGVVAGIIWIFTINRSQVPSTHQTLQPPPTRENRLKNFNEKNITSDTIPPMTSAVEQGKETHKEKSLPQAIAVYLEAEAPGLDHRNLYKNLALALKELRLFDETVAELEKVQQHTPDNLLLHVKLGVLYLVKNKYNLAEKELTAALSENPAYADAYYYLGELFFQTEQYTLAWFADATAHRLGYHGQILTEKLTIEGADAEPLQYPWIPETGLLSFRQIIFPTQINAEQFLKYYQQDDLPSDTMISEWEKHDYQSSFAGSFTPAELEEKIAKVLLRQKPFTEPVIVETEQGFHIIQRVLPFDLASWKKLAHENKSAQPINEQSINEQPIVLKESDEVPLCVDDNYVDLQKRRIYAGAYVKRIDAITAVNRLREEDFPAFCWETTGKDKLIIYNAVAGQFTSFSKAESMLEKLREKGYDQAFISRRKK
jgi:hypothetical protein